MQPEGRSGLDRHPWLFDGGGDVIKDLCFNISLVVVHCTNVVVLFLCFSPQRDDDTVDNNDRSDVYYYLL